jgi:1-acyl-sn-glycerol-3-phosphate acyltransferase
MIWLRSLLFNIWFFAATLLMGLLGAPVRWFARRHALWVAQSWAGLVLRGAEVLCGIRVTVIGREHLPTQGAALIASQHQSAFDTLIWLRLVPRAAYVFKAELARAPLFGSLLVPAGQIPVDRGASFSAVRSLLRGADRAKADNRQIVIFPEGTRVAPGTEAELRPGIAALAARTGLPVIPVATDSGLYWGRRAFRKTPGVIRIVVGPPIPPGLSQTALIVAIQERWREAGIAGGAVDKSVHKHGETLGEGAA